MKKLWWFCGALAFAASAQMRTVQVDAAKVVGTIRSLQGMNNGPVGRLPGSLDMTRQYKEMRIDIVRTHDNFGPVDIDARWSHPDAFAKRIGATSADTVFPDWSKDPEKDESYNFAPTDVLITAIVNAGAEVYYRIGRSWSSDPEPPPDFDKYANIVKHVAMHYNAGWAHGFHYKVRYWEFWNEPNLKSMKNTGPGAYDALSFWSGTPEQFYLLYQTVARVLKAYDPSFMVGGCAMAFGFGDVDSYYKGFIEYCAAHKVPLDFYSWHRYPHVTSDPYELVRYGDQVRAVLDRNGFARTESYITEWRVNNFLGRTDPQNPYTMDNAAFATVAQIYMQDSKIDRSFFNRGEYAFVGQQGELLQKGNAYKALGRLLDTPRRLAATGADTKGFAVLAGRAEDGRKVQILIGNYEMKPLKGEPPVYENNRGYALRVDNLPWGKSTFTVKRYRITQTENFTLTETLGGRGKLELSEALPPPAMEFIVLEKSEPNGSQAR